jgi:hypothetical protein
MSNEQSKDNEMGGACGTYGGGREIRGETIRKEPHGRHRLISVDSFKIDLKKGRKG